MTYPNKHFEVREHDAPTKYVWNGDTRVARVSGSLSARTRTQRLRLYPSWNLVSIAVTASNAVGQLTATSSNQIEALFRWLPQATNYTPLLAGETLAAGSVLWLNCSAQIDVTITGAYSEPTNRSVTTGGDFLPGGGLQTWDFESAISNLNSATAWTYDASSAHSLSRLPEPLQSQSTLSALISPGHTVFVRTAAAAQLEIGPGLSSRYYHQDHLASSASVSDASGSLIEESTFYPFGSPRSHYEPRTMDEPYRFSQKELDRESRLYAFGRRYSYSLLARFVSPDPAFAQPDRLVKERRSSFLSSPQQQNLYGYVANCPSRYIDPDGTTFFVAGGSEKDPTGEIQEFVDRVSRDSGLRLKLEGKPGDSMRRVTIAGELSLSGDVAPELRRLVKEIVDTRTPAVLFVAHRNKPAEFFSDSFFGNPTTGLPARSVALSDFRRLENDYHAPLYAKALLAHVLAEYLDAARHPAPLGLFPVDVPTIRALAQWLETGPHQAGLQSEVITLGQLIGIMPRLPAVHSDIPLGNPPGSRGVIRQVSAGPNIRFRMTINPQQELESVE